MPFINMDKRFKISKMLIDNYILILLILAVVTYKGSNAFGYDSAASCSPNGKLSRRGRAQLLAAIPCDLARQPYCNLPGAAYPWHAVRRFVHENQGLMKRMYGDMRHISVLRDEIKNNDIDIEDVEMAAERYSRKAFRRSSKFKQQRNDADFTYGGGSGSASGSNPKNVDIFQEPHFRPVSTTTTTARPASDGAPIIQTNGAPPTAATAASKATSMRNDESTDADDVEEQASSKNPTAVGGDINDDRNLASNSVYELPTLASNEYVALDPTSHNNGDNIEIIDSPQLSIAFLNNSAPMISATLKATNTRTITVTPATNTTATTKETPTATSTTTTTTTTPTTTSTTTTTKRPTSTADIYHRRRPQYPNRQRPRPQQQQQQPQRIQQTPQKVVTAATTTANENQLLSSIPTPMPAISSTPPSKPNSVVVTKHVNKFVSTNSTSSSSVTTTPFSEKLRRQPVTPTTNRPNPTTSPTTHISASHPPVLRDGQLFQDTLKQEPPAPVVNLRGVNACPVKEEVVAPFWANNTRGEVLALLNLYPFEQYVHWEKCTHEHKQMYCRDGCRCEQQYRLHRLLAYDPRNECRGIFSDWFRFPSCCICKCYNVPMEFRATSRSPRRMQSFPDDEEIDDHFTSHPDDSQSDQRHPLEIAEAQVKKAIYEHATEDWYRPRDYDENDDEDIEDWEA